MRILLAVDGSRSSDRARDLVAALPALEGSCVRIISVVPTISEPVETAWAPVFERDAELVDDSALRTHRDALDAAEHEIRSARSDLVIETVLVRGRPASRIVEEAGSMPADLVVVGHRGHGRWESILLGSVSAEVVDHAPCPVLVARDERIGPIVLADDRSDHARAAEAFMTGWPLFDGLPVTVVTVDEDGFPYSASVPPLVYSESMDAYAYGTASQRRATEADCEAAAMRLRRAGLDADVEVREGDPAHEIVLSARQHGAGLVVVGTRGQTGLRRLVLGSVARKVLLHAPCSVLIVRGGPHVPAPDLATGQTTELVSPFG
jgi:nucleotide-binding universal stress UspA family protein